MDIVHPKMTFVCFIFFLVWNKASKIEGVSLCFQYSQSGWWFRLPGQKKLLIRNLNIYRKRCKIIRVVLREYKIRLFSFQCLSRTHRNNLLSYMQLKNIYISGLYIISDFHYTFVMAKRINDSNIITTFIAKWFYNLFYNLF